jgi:hypothetical protein
MYIWSTKQYDINNIWSLNEWIHIIWDINGQAYPTFRIISIVIELMNEEEIKWVDQFIISQ